MKPLKAEEEASIRIRIALLFYVGVKDGCIAMSEGRLALLPLLMMPLMNTTPK